MIYDNILSGIEKLEKIIEEEKVKKKPGRQKGEKIGPYKKRIKLDKAELIEKVRVKKIRKGKTKPYNDLSNELKGKKEQLEEREKRRKQKARLIARQEAVLHCTLYKKCLNMKRQMNCHTCVDKVMKRDCYREAMSTDLFNQDDNLTYPQ